MKLRSGKITIEVEVNTIGELVKELQTIFPEGKWMDFGFVYDSVLPVGPTYREINNPPIDNTRNPYITKPYVGSSNPYVNGNNTFTSTSSISNTYGLNNCGLTEEEEEMHGNP